MTVLRGLRLKTKRALTTSRLELSVGFATVGVLAYILSAFNEMIVQPNRKHGGDWGTLLINGGIQTVVFLFAVGVAGQITRNIFLAWTMDDNYFDRFFGLFTKNALRNFSLCWAACGFTGSAAVVAFAGLPSFGYTPFAAVTWGAIINILFLVGWGMAPLVKNRLSPTERRWRKFNAQALANARTTAAIEPHNRELAEAEIMFVTAAERMMDLHGVNPLTAVVQADEWLEQSRGMSSKASKKAMGA